MDIVSDSAEAPAPKALLDSLAEGSGAPDAVAIPAKKSRGQDGTGRSTSLTPESAEEEATHLPIQGDERLELKSGGRAALGTTNLGLIDVDHEQQTEIDGRDQLDGDEDENEDESTFLQNDSQEWDRFGSKSGQQDRGKGGGFQQKVGWPAAYMLSILIWVSRPTI